MLGPEDTPDVEEEVDEQVEYEDDPFNEFLEEEEEVKPEPLAFPDAYAAAEDKPVALEVPRHKDAFTVLEKAKESRYPAERVAKSATELAKALKAATTKR